MKKMLSWVLVCLLCLAPVLGLAAESYFPWLAMNVTLRLDWADVAEIQEQDLTLEDGYKFVQLHFTIMDGPRPAEEINANIEVINLRDADSEYYKVAALQMPGVEYDAATGTYSTDEDQTEFDLFYMVPEDVELSTIDLRAPAENEGEFFVIHLSDVAPNPDGPAQ